MRKTKFLSIVVAFPEVTHVLCLIEYLCLLPAVVAFIDLQGDLIPSQCVICNSVGAVYLMYAIVDAGGISYFNLVLCFYISSFRNSARSAGQSIIDKSTIFQTRC